MTELTYTIHTTFIFMQLHVKPCSWLKRNKTITKFNILNCNKERNVYAKIETCTTVAKVWWLSPPTSLPIYTASRVALIFQPIVSEMSLRRNKAGQKFTQKIREPSKLFFVNLISRKHTFPSAFLGSCRHRKFLCHLETLSLVSRWSTTGFFSQSKLDRCEAPFLIVFYSLFCRSQPLSVNFYKQKFAVSFRFETLNKGNEHNPFHIPTKEY